jgi:hypothetical protein
MYLYSLQIKGDSNKQKTQCYILAFSRGFLRHTQVRLGILRLRVKYNCKAMATKCWGAITLYFYVVFTASLPPFSYFPFFYIFMIFRFLRHMNLKPLAFLTSHYRGKDVHYQGAEEIPPPIWGYQREWREKCHYSCAEWKPSFLTRGIRGQGIPVALWVHQQEWKVSTVMPESRAMDLPTSCFPLRHTRRRKPWLREHRRMWGPWKAIFTGLKQTVLMT